MCDIAIGASLDDNCTNGQGGVEEFYPFNFVTDAFTVVDGIATSMNVALTAAYKYVNGSDANTFTDVLLADKKTGNSVATQTLVYQLNKIKGATNLELTKLAQGKMSGVLKDNAGVYHWVGAEKGFNVSANVEAVSGGGTNDVSGYNVTLISENKALAPTLDAATVTAFLAILA
tara:strand:+ start:834 stop:1355 length:522 start_codon:yes stop_codon:yes gene_type:complete